MSTVYSDQIVKPGQAAPDFCLPMVDGELSATLGAYSGTTPFLLTLVRSFSCPFCRRLIAKEKGTADSLATVGVDFLAVTTTPLKQARLYSKYRPSGLSLACDPELGIHRDYGVPLLRVTPDRPTNWPLCLNPEDLAKIRINPTGELPEPRPLLEVGAAMDQSDGFEAVPTDEKGPPDDISPLVSYFLIDRAGIVRWLFVEAPNDPTEYGRHPGDEELLAAAQRLPA